MAVGHVRADHEEDIGVIEVLIGAGRPVGAQRLFVPGTGAGHAQPRVRFDLIGADEALREFVGQVLRFQRHLAGHIERDRIGTVFVDDAAEPAGGVGDDLIEVARRQLGAPLGPHPGCVESSTGGEHLRRRRSLGAQAAEVGRMVGASDGLAHDRQTGDTAGFGGVGVGDVDLEDHAAPDAAVGAQRFDGGGAHASKSPEHMFRGSALAVTHLST